jgi:hypothetical protein
MRGVPIRQPRRIDWRGLDQGKTVKYGQEQENAGFFYSVTTVLASGFVAEDTIRLGGADSAPLIRGRQPHDYRKSKTAV